MRLRVRRDQLTKFERLVIDDLIPKGNEIDSRELQEMHASRDFDPMAKAQEWVYALARESRSLRKTSRASRAFSFALFLTGFVLVIADAIRRNPHPAVMLSPWVVAVLTAVWPSQSVWRRTRKSRYGGLLLLIPMVVMFALIVLLHTSIAEPLGAAGSIGIVLACLGAYHAMVADAAKSGGNAVARIVDLAAAEEWFRRELRAAQPRTRREWQPYLAAFGLRDEIDKEDEDWGWALQTHGSAGSIPRL